MGEEKGWVGRELIHSMPLSFLFFFSNNKIITRITDNAYHDGFTVLLLSRIRHTVQMPKPSTSYDKF